MPLIHFHVTEGQDDATLKKMLDAAHEAVLEAFRVPADDRYQMISEHKPGRMVLLDTGLGFTRGDTPVLVQVFTSTRPKDQKLEFYRLLSEKLHDAIGLDPKDLLISVMENTRDDWSFGFGRAQYVTGELG